VISVGNLTVGGTGKTPLVAFLATRLKELEYDPVVLGHGYTGTRRRPALIVSDGAGIKSKPAECGDEAYMLARKLVGIPVAAGKNRYRAGLLLSKETNRRVYLLDDGFQHMKLSRKADLLLIDGSRDLKQEALLPAGRLREPLTAMERADAILVTRAHLTDDLPQLVAEIRKFNTSAPVFPFSHEIDAVYDLVSQERFSPTDFRGQEVIALAALGSPSQFLQDLERAGVKVAERMLFRDHHRFSRTEIQAALERRRELGAAGIMTTEKDAVRLEHLEVEPSQVYVVSIKATTRDPATFMNWLVEKLESR
jgi:tetraacyldisaccharide 4'-kinase